MAAIEQELLEQFKKLDTTQKKRVLDFVHGLVQPSDNAQLPELISAPRITPAELVAWLDANPPTESWGDLRDDEDAADYIHRVRHSSWSTPDDA